MKILNIQILFSQKQTMAIFLQQRDISKTFSRRAIVESVLGCAGYHCWELISFTFNNLQAQKIRNLKITNFHSTVSPP